MKTAIFVIASILSANVFAGEGKSTTTTEHPEKYCAKIKDGNLVVMHQGNEITSTETLANGTKIQADGTIIDKYGSQTTLKAGECLDKEGKVVMKVKEKSKEKMKQKK